MNETLSGAEKDSPSATSVPRSDSPPATSSPPPPLEPRKASDQQRAASPRAPKFYVLVPSLSPSVMKAYKPTSETPLKIDMDAELDEIIGEYKEGNTLYYFARYQGGIAHKHLAGTFSKKYPALVQQYKEAKAAGEYSNFDPSAAYVHPLSRVRMRISISQDRGRAKVDISSARSLPSDNDNFDDEGESSDADDYSNGYAESTSTAPPRRVTRQSKQTTLPFSPKKTRSQRITTIDDSGSEEESSRPTRKSTRLRNTIKVPLDSDYEDLDEEDVSDYGRRNNRSVKGKKPSQPKFPLPSYGNIRNIEALKEDPYPTDAANATLRNHRMICEKCHSKPAHSLLRDLGKRKGKGKKRKRDSENEFEFSDEEDRCQDLGGWVRCLKCPVSTHWQCLSGAQQNEILKAARAKDVRDWQSEGKDFSHLPRRTHLDIDETTEFVCGACNKGGVCMGCLEMMANVNAPSKPQTDANGDVLMQDVADEAHAHTEPTPSRELNFRCFTCKRAAHYEHLPVPRSLPPTSSLVDIAEHYQAKSWLCADCSSFCYSLDKIIAWRPYPANAQEPPRPANHPPNYKEHLPREYLVKWNDRSYRRLSWVPHMWLVSTNQAKLKNFLAGGTKIDLLRNLPEDEMDPISETTVGPVPFEIGATSRASSSHPIIAPYGPLDALPDAERRIPSAWKTVDRVLDIVLWVAKAEVSQKKGRNRGDKNKRVVTSEDEDDSMNQDDHEHDEALDLVFERGELGDEDRTMSISDWEDQHGTLTEDNIDDVVWAFIKWDDLGYDESSWDSPPRRGEPGYDAFIVAFKRFLHSRTVIVPKLTKAHAAEFDNRPADGYRKYVLKDPSALNLGQNASLKLMPFQVDGFNWLCNNWWNRQPCILADDMGLGKTVQMATFLGTVATRWRAFPVLVVVPNSTITNWVREFERWAPQLRVVPFYGEKKARDVIKQFELFHKEKVPGNTDAKFHVLVTTYEAIIHPKDFGLVFKRQPRWEVLVVDEGQRLKSDSSLLFKKLNELNSAHRVIMTGTPLNNNMRELFNLMNFLDPVEWKDLEDLEKQHEELDEELIKQLHNRLRPYFLRRIKSEVLQLPPKNEVIVPVSMAPLQRQIYRSILSHNLDLLKGLSQPSKVNSGAKGKLNNVLMHLRKRVQCLQHPYLYSEDIEPRGLPPQETHDKLVDASGKLRLLKVLLAKLKERGHRVLLFSQFVIALDVVEDFLNGEGLKYLRLDGNTKGSERQKSMDEFNKPGSDYFIFLLTTRAGGVGINLFTADTVIIFDPDFNPHQDLQAIARAYRYGQKNTCLVFKLMMKDSAEERIMQIGKKKLVLDHLIVQKMDEDEDSPGENIQSILTYGAQALFDQDHVDKDITYSEHDIDKLIEKTEQEGEEMEAPKEGGLSFSFAKIWAADKDELDEVPDEDQIDSWAQTLETINQEREKEREKEEALSGRGARRRAADVAKTRMHVQPMEIDSPKNRKRSASDASAYSGSAHDSGDSSSSSSAEGDGDFEMDIADLDMGKKKPKKKQIPFHKPVNIEDMEPSPQEDLLACGLCGGNHGVKQCLMTDRSENLAEYREMLIMHADDEPWEERSAAVRAIDELLNSRGHLHLIQGQPLHPLLKTSNIPPINKPKQAADAARAYLNQQQGRPQPAPVQQPQMRYQEERHPTTVVRNFTQSANPPVPVSAPLPHAGNAVAGPSNHSYRPSLGNAAPPGTASPAGSGGTAGVSPSPYYRSSVYSISAGPAMNNGRAVQRVSAGRCQLCGAVPIHMVKDCPLVLQGSKSVSGLIEQLEREGRQDPEKLALVEILCKILRKQRRKEAEEA